jgi:hypothetical protein
VKGADSRKLELSPAPLLSGKLTFVLGTYEISSRTLQLNLAAPKRYTRTLFLPATIPLPAFRRLIRLCSADLVGSRVPCGFLAGLVSLFLTGYAFHLTNCYNALVWLSSFASPLLLPLPSTSQNPAPSEEALGMRSYRLH